MKTKNLVEGKFIEDPEMVQLARQYLQTTMPTADPEAELMGIKNWESCIFLAFNETLYKMAPMIMDTPEFREGMIEFLKAKKR